MKGAFRHECGELWQNCDCTLDVIPERNVREAKGAVISDDGKYRYALWRDWNAALPLVTWCMLNPSTADADVDDPTIRRCIGFSRRLGYGGMEVVNLYAYRVTSPRELWRIERYGGDVFGPRNQDFQLAATPEGRTVICAWGANKGRFYPDTNTLYCLGKTKDGYPRHPLYLSGSVGLERYLVS